MFLPKEYIETDVQVQKQLIKENPLGTLITNDPELGLNANHIPFIVRDTDDPNKFQLIAHFHKENECAQQLQYAHDHDQEVLIVFKGYDRYNTPSWYPSKVTNDGKVAPTWLYSAVHVYGKPTLHTSKSSSKDELHSILKQESIQFETDHTDKSKLWELEETPEPYLNLLKGMIYGLVIEVTRTEGKWKLNQKQRKEDVKGTSDGLKCEAGVRPLSGKMAEDVEEFHLKYCAAKKF